MSDSIDLLEFTRVTKAREVDESKGVLYDLVALGPVSENGRDYPEKTMREALHLFEGKQSYANHHKGQGDPSVYDVLGVWKECRVEGGKVRGNFHYFKSHPMAGRLVEAATRPELNAAFGFSINARGRERRENGRGVIEGIDRLTSIDCVGMPATTKGLHESRGGGMTKLTVKDIQERLKGSRPDYCRALAEMAEAGLMAPDTAMPEPAAAGGRADHQQAILDACKACIDDASLAPDEKVKKIKKLLAIGAGSDSTASDSDSPSEDDSGNSGAAANESKAMKTESKANAELAELRAKLQEVEARDRLRSAADEAGVKLPKALLESVRPDVTEAQAKALVAELRQQNKADAARPRSAAPVTESKDSPKREDVKDIARRILAK